MRKKNNIINYDEIRGRESEDYIEEYVPNRPKFSDDIEEYEPNEYIDD